MARELILKLGKKITDRVDVKLGMTKLDENSPEYYGLASVVTDEMAELALAMKVRVPTTPAEIGKKVGKDPVYVEQLFDQMSMIGLLEYNWENADHHKQWTLPIFVPGSAELMNMNLQQVETHPEIAQFFERMSFLPLTKITCMVPPGGAGVGMHVIPVEKAIPATNESVDVEHISHWLKKYEGHIGVGYCSCRNAMRIQGEGCGELQDELCIAVGQFADYCRETGKGRDKVNYKLRDWVFSRQRYWGEPIPMVHCDKCGWQPLPESSLPLTLPDITDFEPGPDGESPLARHKDWVKTTCPCCGGPATRETDTMPQWAGSSWYFLRYMDPHCKDALASKEALEYWSPVDWYNGGMEHTTLHLLYSRFWHKFLYDIGVVPTAEPYQKRTAHGMILGLNPHSFVNLPAEEQEKLLKEYGSQKAAEKALEEKYGEMARHPIVKMSKSLGNVINPDEVVDQYGADTMRLYEMFMGDFEQAAPWQTSAIAGCNRFLDRVWALSDKLVEGEGYRPQVETLMHQTIKKVGADIEGLKMNTAIAQLMTLVNALYDNGGATRAEFETVVQLLNPFAPHMTEELWEKLGHSHDEQLAYYPWPAYEEAKCVEAAVEIAVQVNGKVKARLKVAADIDAAAAIAAAKADPAVAAALEGKQLVKEIYVKGRLVNLAVKG